MLIDHNISNQIGALSNHPTSNLSEIKSNLEANKSEESTSNKSNTLNNKHLLVSNEKELTTSEQAKKSIIEQVLGNMFDNGNEEKAMPLFPSVQYEMLNFQESQSSAYSNESILSTNGGFLYESSEEYYQKTTIDFSAKAMISTPQGQYEIEINFQYTEEIYTKHSSAIALQQENLHNNPLEVTLDNDDDSLKNLKQINLLFDIKNEERLEKEKEKNQILLKFLQSLFNKKPQNEEDKKNKEIQNNFFNEVTVYEQSDESYDLAAQIQNGIGMYFSHEKSESAYMDASYDSNGNFSFQAGYSNYESTSLEIKV